ncbi:AcrR family transcriptional regulator [Agromyces flavus]|uniref:AcrR family transcriptional regulator n=1 Tax=Agromyces flavus TaxID=589382 RepID=A0A1H1VU30_9MICO|nr:TetR/AcrR family transcriptional regulator [Agromyces flavus]MCP2366012.1 AcrR family transcriptional regulator [Agromyces flavus]SDS88427.1 DNA-binding transcriptional regulator, AcrR family [Agromyces flavus]
MATRTTSSGTSAARERLLATASELFYREGIHAVGVDRIIAEAGVTRATFYRHFPSKESLVEAYLGVEDANIKAAFAAAEATGAEPAPLVDLVIDGLADDIARHHTRGCPFINAAAEYPDAASGVRTTVARHREWFRSELEELLGAAGAPEPAESAAELVLLRDAAMVGGYLDGWDRVRPAFVASARRIAGVPGTSAGE